MEYQSATIGELAKALAKAQGSMTFAAKDSKAPVFDASKKQVGTRKYADLYGIIEAIRDHLSQNSLAYVQAVMPSDIGIRVRTTLMHESGEWIAGEITLPVDRMNGPQGMGSSITYARRYALAAIVGIAQDDDDGQAAQDTYNKQAKAEQQREVQKTREQASTNNSSPPTPNLHKAFMATLTQKTRASGSKEEQRDVYLKELSGFFRRNITSSKELTDSEMREYMDAVNSDKQPMQAYPF